MYNPVGFFLAQDVTVLNDVLQLSSLRSAGEQVDHDLLGALRRRGIDRVTIRIFPPLPVNYAKWPRAKFEAWLDTQFDAIAQEES